MKQGKCGYYIKKTYDYEMVHWCDGKIFIAHKSDIITYSKNNKMTKIHMPNQSIGLKKVFMPLRKWRRLLRLDKAMIMPTKIGFVLFRFNEIWVYMDNYEKWVKSDTSLNCRNPMYNGVLLMPNGDIFVGEYGKKNGIGKRIFKSSDNGIHWECVYTFPNDEISHIHCLAWDMFENRIWIFTGDSDKECRVICTDSDFKEMEYIGGGSQYWRACHAIFTKETVEWIMDSPLQMVYHIKYYRKTRKIICGATFAGPVWFAKKYDNGFVLAASVQEIGISHRDKLLHLYISSDLEEWKEIITFEHDGWPKGYFRFGTMTITRSDKQILISCEGVKGYDGKTIEIAKK